MFRLSKNISKKQRNKEKSFSVPLQFFPFPVNPVLQRHVKLPNVFLQIEFEPQLYIPFVHSLMSKSQILTI